MVSSSSAAVKVGVSFFSMTKPYAESLANMTETVVSYIVPPVVIWASGAMANPALKITANLTDKMALLFSSPVHLHEAAQIKKCVAEARDILMQRAEKEQRYLEEQLKP